jgi:hypothetical protein
MRHLHLFHHFFCWLALSYYTIDTIAIAGLIYAVALAINPLSICYWPLFKTVLAEIPKPKKELPKH